jgi:hypothetical protein
VTVCSCKHAFTRATSRRSVPWPFVYHTLVAKRCVATYTHAWLSYGRTASSRLVLLTWTQYAAAKNRMRPPRGLFFSSFFFPSRSRSTSFEPASNNVFGRVVIFLSSLPRQTFTPRDGGLVLCALLLPRQMLRNQAVASTGKESAQVEVCPIWLSYFALFCHLHLYKQVIPFSRPFIFLHPF